MWRLQVARSLSIVGHPLVFFPCAVWMALAFFALLALCVMLYSWLQVRRGRWGHVDASLPHERRSLNGVLLSALSVSALVVWLQPRARGLALGITLSCFLICAALLTARWLKASLHVAFLVFASTILWQVSLGLVVAALAFTGAVGWSRVELHRHPVAEVLVGAGLGLVAGGAFWFVVLRVWG